MSIIRHLNLAIISLFSFSRAMLSFTTNPMVIDPIVQSCGTTNADFYLVVLWWRLVCRQRLLFS